MGRFKELLAVATLPVLTGYAAVATVLATVAALATESAFSVTGVLLAAGPGWLAAYQVPVVIGDHELGLLPLALTIGVCALVARSAFGAAERLDCRTPREAGVVIGTVAGTHAVVGVTIAVLANGAFVSADPIAAFGLPGLVSGVAATVGVARPCGLVDVLCSRADAAALAGMRAAALGMAGLLAASALVLTVATAFAVPTMQTLFAANAPGFGSGFGMLLLSLGYLPNVVLSVLAFLLGPGFTLGTTSVGPLDFESGPVPAVPLLAGLPETYAAWWPALLVLPALVGAGVGWTLRASSPAPVERVRSVAVAGAVIGFATVVLTTLAGGALAGSGAAGASGGSGAAGGVPFPGLLLPAGLLSVAAFAWIVVPGALVAWLTGPRAVSDAADGVSDTADGELATDDDESPAPDDELDGADSADADGASDADAADTTDSDDSPGSDDDSTADAEDAVAVEDAADTEGSADAADTCDAAPDADADSADSAREDATDAEVGHDAAADTESAENDRAEADDDDDVADNDRVEDTATDDDADNDRAGADAADRAKADTASDVTTAADTASDAHADPDATHPDAADPDER